MDDLQGTVIILMTGLSNLAPGERSRNKLQYGDVKDCVKARSPVSLTQITLKEWDASP